MWHVCIACMSLVLTPHHFKRYGVYVSVDVAVISMIILPILANSPKNATKQMHYIVIWFFDGCFLFRLVSARKREREREGVWRYRGGFSYSLFFVCLFVILTISPLFISFVFSLKLAFAGFSVSSLVLSRFCILVFGISRARETLQFVFQLIFAAVFYVSLFFSLKVNAIF